MIDDLFQWLSTGGRAGLAVVVPLSIASVLAIVAGYPQGRLRNLQGLVAANMRGSSTLMARPLVVEAATGAESSVVAATAEMRASWADEVEVLVETAAMQEGDEKPRVGHGGSVEMHGDKDIAVGGRGGRGGNVPGATGGDGGGGVHRGPGTSIGGDGGDAGRMGRPTLGAASPLERQLGTWYANVCERDRYGFLVPGRGGDSGQAEVVCGGRAYSLTVLLKLLRLWRDEVVDAVDDLTPDGPQAWWDFAVAMFPDECE